jgi:hypothetical protein
MSATARSWSSRSRTVLEDGVDGSCDVRTHELGGRLEDLVDRHESRMGADVAVLGQACASDMVSRVDELVVVAELVEKLLLDHHERLAVPACDGGVEALDVLDRRGLTLFGKNPYLRHQVDRHRDPQRRDGSAYPAPSRRLPRRGVTSTHPI